MSSAKSTLMPNTVPLLLTPDTAVLLARNSLIVVKLPLL
jgi:hypothetical protein